MKRFFVVLIALAMLTAALFGCAPAKKEVVLPPTRWSPKGRSGIVDYETLYSFESAFDAADAVARVEVGNWLGEDLDRLSTYYEATVLELFKGEMPTNFTLEQQATSDTTINAPLFTHGNELFLFLNQTSEDLGYDNHYYIVAPYLTEYVSYDRSGNRYYMTDIIYKGMGNDTLEVTNELYLEIIAVAAESDPAMEEIVYVTITSEEKLMYTIEQRQQ